MSGRDVTLKFIISEPWYWNFYSKSVYFLIIMCLSWFLYKVHLKRLSEQNQKLLVEKETELKKQQEKNKQEIIRLRNEQLEQDVLRKSEELANSTMQLIKKNELLIKLKAESQHIEAQTKKGMLSQMIKLIDKNISSEQDWHFFEQNFTRVHEAFFKKLLEKFPDLSQGDLKLCAYLKMNLSTKEIAQLLNITYRSVELKRYRLRKKLNLDTEANLVEWLMSEF